jgi:hypothetical protein
VGLEQDLKRAMGGSIFLRDVRNVEPAKKGWIVGDNVRFYVDEQAGNTVSFLRGTDEKTRKTYRDKLDTARIPYKAGPDFAS